MRLPVRDPAVVIWCCQFELSAAGVMPISAGVFFFLRGFVVGQERFQNCDAGFDFRDVSVQLGHYPPDLVITCAHGLPSPTSSSPSSAESSASLPATSCRWAIASAARAWI